MRFGRIAGAIIAALGVGGAASAAPPDPLPAVRFEQQTTLTSPSDANTQYPGSTTSTVSFARETPAEYKALARAFGRDRIGIDGFTATDYAERAFEYVRNNIDITPIFGSQKGGFGALIDQNGTAFDQAQLLVELLREGGLTAEYQLGTISLDQDQVSDWLGAKTPRAACRLLADGAIPARINSSTNCDSLSNSAGASFNAEIMHVWVKALGRNWDPAYKTYTWHDGIDLNAAIGCGAQCDTALETLLGATQGANGLVNQNLIQHASGLDGYAADLYEYLMSDANGLLAKETVEIVGGREFEPNLQIGVDDTLPYTLSVMRTWTGGVPDAFRAKIGIQFQTIDVEYFADDVYMEEIIVYPTNAEVINNAALQDPPIFLTPYLFVGGQYTQYPAYQFFTTTQDLRLDVTRPYLNHPYATEVMEREAAIISVNVSGGLRLLPFAVVHGWGGSGRGREAYLIEKNSEIGQFHLQSEQGLCEMEGEDSPFFTAGAYVACAAGTSLARAHDLAGHASQWLSEVGDLFELEAGMTDTSIQHHGSLGYIYSDGQNFSVTGEISGSPISIAGPTIDWSYVDIVSSMSVSSLVSSDDDRRAAVFTTAAVMNGFESGAARRADRGPNLILSGQGLYQVAAGCNVPMKEFQAGTVVSGLEPTFMPARINLMNAYLADGFNVVTPTDDFVSRCNSDQQHFIDAFNQAPILAYKPDGSSVAYLSTQEGENYTGPNGFVVVSKGGSTGGSPAFGIVGIPDPTQEGREAVADRLSLPQIDLASGRLQLTEDPDIVTGAGEFPYSLDFTRTYDSSRISGDGFGAVEQRQIFITPSGTPQVPASVNIQGNKYEALGWSHNHDIQLSPLSDVSLGLGEESPLNAVDALVTLHLANESMRGVWSLEKIMALTQSSIWLNNQLFENAVSISSSGFSGTFTRMPGRLCLNSQAPNYVSEVTGYTCLSGSVGTYDVIRQFGFGKGVVRNTRQGAILAWDTLDVRYELHRANGEVMYFDESATDLEIELHKPIVRWTFPSGVELTYCYTQGNDCSVFDDLVTGEIPVIGGTAEGGTRGTQLFKVENNLGRSLTINYDDPEAITVSDDSGRQVVYTFHQLEHEFSGPGTIVSTLIDRTLASVTFPDQTQKRYNYTNQAFRSPFLGPISGYGGGAVPTEFDTYLSEVFIATDLTTPVITIGYDEAWRPISQVDVSGKTVNFYPGSLGTERWRFGETITPFSGGDIVTRSWFDENGIEFRSINPRGVETNTQIDGLGRETEIIVGFEGWEPGAYYARSSYEYDVWSNTIVERQHSRTVDSVEYTPSATAVFAPDVETPLETTRTYDVPSFPNLMSSETDPFGTVIVRNDYFPESGLLQRKRGPSGEETTYEYNVFGQISRSTQQLAVGSALITDYSYSPVFSNLDTLTTDVGGFNYVSSFGYDSVGNLLSITDPRGNTKTVTYDDRRRLETLRNPDSGGSNYTYNEIGQVIFFDEITETGVARTEVSYWPNRRPRTVVQPSGDQTNYTYDAIDRLDTVTDQDGLITRRNYYPDGLIESLTNGVGTPIEQTEVRFWYDALSNVARHRPARGNRLGSDPANQAQAIYDNLYSYDLFARSTGMTYPDGSSEVLQLRPDGLAQRKYVRANSAVDLADRNYIEYFYDASKRVINQQEVYPLEGNLIRRTSETTYDRAGRVVTRRETNGSDAADNLTGVDESVTYQYDALSRVESETVNGGRQVTYAYDGNNNRTEIVWPDGFSVQYEYDPVDRLVRVVRGSDQAILTSYIYDLRSRLVDGAKLNGVNVDFGYNLDSELTDLDYSNLTSELGVSETLAWDYGYTPAGRLSATSLLDPLQPSWSPDFARLVNYATANVLDQYEAISDRGLLTYDERGNLQTSSGRSYNYDLMNRLIEASVSGKVVRYDYDVSGRRVGKNVDGIQTSFLHAKDMEIAEYGNNGQLLRRFIPAGSIDARIAMVEVSPSGQETFFYYHGDRIGSIAVMTDEDGEIVGRYAFDPFGNEITGASLSGNPFRFVGRRLDPETGLYYFRARYYDADLGRFLQADPIGYEDQWNLYTYVSNDPLNATDPTGKQTATTGVEGHIAAKGRAVAGSAFGFAGPDDEGFPTAGLAVSGGVGIGNGAAIGVFGSFAPNQTTDDIPGQSLNASLDLASLSAGTSTPIDENGNHQTDKSAFSAGRGGGGGNTVTQQTTVVLVQVTGPKVDDDPVERDSSGVPITDSTGNISIDPGLTFTFKEKDKKTGKRKRFRFSWSAFGPSRQNRQ